MKQFAYLLLLSCFLNPASASIVYTNEIDLGGNDSGASFDYHWDTSAAIPSDVVLTSADIGFGLVEDVKLRSLDFLTTKGHAATGDDLRVDFLYGAKDQVSIGYLVEDVVNEVRVYDENDNLLTTQTFTRAPVYDVVNPGFEHGSGPEFFDGYDGQLDIPFSGTAAYMIFDFDVDEVSDRSEYQVDNLQMNAAQNQVLDRYNGAMVKYAAESTSSNPRQQIFDLHVTQEGIGGLAPLYIKSSLLGDYQIDISGEAQLSSLAVIQELYQTPLYSRFNINIEGIDYQPSVSDAFWEYGYVYGNGPFTSARISGLEIIDGSTNNGVLHALRFAGEGDVRITITSLNQISEPKWLFAISLVTLMLSGFRKCNSE